MRTRRDVEPLKLFRTLVHLRIAEYLYSKTLGRYSPLCDTRSRRDAPVGWRRSEGRRLTGIEVGC